MSRRVLDKPDEMDGHPRCIRYVASADGKGRGNTPTSSNEYNQGISQDPHISQRTANPQTTSVPFCVLPYRTRCCCCWCSPTAFFIHGISQSARQIPPRRPSPPKVLSFSVKSRVDSRLSRGVWHCVLPGSSVATFGGHAYTPCTTTSPPRRAHMTRTTAHRFLAHFVFRNALAVQKRARAVFPGFRTRTSVARPAAGPVAAVVVAKETVVTTSPVVTPAAARA